MAGYIRELYKLIARSPGWRKVRSERIKLDRGQCRVCTKRKRLQVHHVRPFRLRPELELDINNTITLCGRCHILIGHLDNWKSFNSNLAADVQAIFNRIKFRP